MRTKQRWLATISLAVPLSLIVAGCAGSPDAPDASGDGSGGSAYGGALGTPEVEDAFADLYQSAIDAGQYQVVMYGPTPAQAYTDAFTERFPDIEIISEYLQGQDRLTRLEAEKASGNYVADLVYDGKTPIVTLANTGWCSTVDPFVDIPEAMISEDKMVIYPQASIFGLAINTDLLDEDEIPHTWEDLVDPKWKGKIAMVSPAAGGSGAYGNAQLLTPEANAERWGWPIVEGLKANVATVGQDSLALSSVIDGPYPVSMLTHYPRFMEALKNAPDAPVEFVLLDEGNIWSADAECHLASSPNPLATELWLNWILTAEAQTVNAGTGAFPTRPEIAGPGGLPSAAEVSLTEQLPPADAATGYTKYVKEIQALYGG